MENNKLLEIDVSPEIKDRLIQYGSLKKFSQDDVILNEKSYIKAIPIVISGSIRVLRSDAEGKAILLYYIKSGESCIMSFLGGLHHDTSKIKAIAEEDTEILFIPMDKVSQLIKEFPQWLDYIFRLYHKRFEELLDVVNSIAFKKVDERLLQNIRLKAKLTGNNSISITHDQLAKELGTARVVVSRLLKQMEDEGIVQLGRNKIILL